MTNKMTGPQDSTALNAVVAYPASGAETEGIFTQLPEKLAGTVDFDNFSLKTWPTSKRLTLWFRHGAKKIFHISVVRRGGRSLVQIGGLNPTRVLGGIKVCRDHFDKWFGIRSQDIIVYEKRKEQG
jgi:hypothetical protein